MDLRTFGLVGLAALGLLSLSCEGPIETLGVKIPYEKRVLGNGLTVILVEDNTVPIVSYQTWYRVGSVDEQPGITGISHLFEHLMFKGTAKYGPKAFFNELEAKGAEVNAFTTRDYTVYYENFVPDLLEKVIDMESDRMTKLKLDEETLVNERLVVLEERRLRTDSTPDGRVQEALWGLSYRRHPYSWPVIGYPQDLLSLNTTKVQEYYRSHYHPGNAAVVVVGAINAAKTFEWIRSAYEVIPGRPAPPRAIPAEPESKEEKRLTLYDNVASETFSQAYHVTAADDEDSYALDVLANILFEGSSSRAYRRLVEEKDLLLGIAGSAYTPTYPGLFIISASLKSGVASSKAEAALDELIREVQEKEVTADEIAIAVKQLTVNLVDSIRTPYGLGQLIGTVQMIFGDPQRFAQDLNRYLRVTASDVRRVAREYIVPNNRAIVMMVPMEKKGKASP